MQCRGWVWVSLPATGKWQGLGYASQWVWTLNSPEREDLSDLVGEPRHEEETADLGESRGCRARQDGEKMPLEGEHNPGRVHSQGGQQVVPLTGSGPCVRDV